MGAAASQITSLTIDRSKKTSKLRVIGLCAGTSPGPVNSPHKWPVTRKMLPFDDVIMIEHLSTTSWKIPRIFEGERWYSPQEAFFPMHCSAKKHRIFKQKS